MPQEATTQPTNGRLLWPYLAPYVAYVVVASLLSERVPRELDYSVRLLLTGGALFWFRRQLWPLAGLRPALGSVLWGIVAGILGVGVWVGLLLPFQEATAGEAWTLSQLGFRIAAAVLVVPLAEELLFRRYVFGVAVQWDEARALGRKDPFGDAIEARSILDLSPGAWTWIAVLIASVAFALGHTPVQWLAATAYGGLMALCRVRRGDMVAPIVAHATTNLVLYIYVYQSGSWGLW